VIITVVTITMASSLPPPFPPLVLLLLLLVVGSRAGAEAAAPDVGGVSWYDCSAEVGIGAPSLSFSSVSSLPPVVTKDSHQVIYKELSSRSDLAKIEAQLTQMYKLFDRRWVPFLKTPFLDECAEHDGSQVDPRGVRDGPLCPLVARANATTVFTVHPPLNRMTPYGLYRSRQVYRDAHTKELVGCVDMRFLYCESAAGLAPDSETCRPAAGEEETTTSRAGSSSGRRGGGEIRPPPRGREATAERRLRRRLDSAPE
jgi:hypothetical protein